MGLDWIARAKTVDGIEMPAVATLGHKRVSRDDPQTVELYRAIYDSHRAAADRGETFEGHRKHWQRPFDEVLDQAITEEKYIETPGAEAAPGGGGSFLVNQTTSYRGKILQYAGIPDGELVERFFGDEEGIIQIDEAKAIADELQVYVDDPSRLRQESGDEADRCVEAIREGIAYLRFWSERGHSIWAWY